MKNTSKTITREIGINAATSYINSLADGKRLKPRNIKNTITLLQHPYKCVDTLTRICEPKQNTIQMWTNHLPPLDVTSL